MNVYLGGKEHRHKLIRTKCTSLVNESILWPDKLSHLLTGTHIRRSRRVESLIFPLVLRHKFVICFSSAKRKSNIDKYLASLVVHASPYLRKNHSTRCQVLMSLKKWECLPSFNDQGRKWIQSSGERRRKNYPDEMIAGGWNNKKISSLAL